MTTNITYKERDGSVRILSADAVLRETSDMQSEVTQFPVERGAPITDNIRDMPPTLVLEVLITNTPIVAPQSHADGATGSYQPAGGASLLKFSAEFDRPRAVRADLERLKGQGLEFTITSRINLYTEYYLRGIQLERGEKTGNAVKFLLTFVHILFADTLAAPVPRRIPRTRPPVPQGAQPPTPAQRATLAHRLYHDIVDGSE